MGAAQSEAVSAIPDRATLILVSISFTLYLTLLFSFGDCGDVAVK